MSIKQQIDAAKGFNGYLKQLTQKNDLQGLLNLRVYKQQQQTKKRTEVKVIGYRSPVDADVWSAIDRMQTQIDAVDDGILSVKPQLLRRYLFQVHHNNLPGASDALKLARGLPKGLNPSERQLAISIIENSKQLLFQGASR